MNDNVIMRVVARWAMPLILLFAFYTQVHGETGPGGGFQAGVMIAAAFVLYGLVFGGNEMRRIVPRRLTDITAVLGVLVYAGTGVYALATGYNFLDHVALMPGNRSAAEAWGMTAVEYGVGITVASVMLTLFNEITEGTNPGQEPDTVAPDAQERLWG